MGSNNNQGSPSFRRACDYDVFISFRGPDTRGCFVDHLYNHLIGKGISVFKDDRTLEIGESIPSQLEQAIKCSRISLVVFSCTYAGSNWCLDEMAIIAECQRELEQKVIPIFYHVEPSDVRHQNGVYMNAFDSLADEFEENPGKVVRWRSAMNKLANSVGFPIKRGDEEWGIIARIVQEVIAKLRHKFSRFADGLIGIQSRVEELEKLLNLSPNDDSRQVLGILGMGGIGKSTHASVLYDKISHQFHACCFIEDVNHIYETDGSRGAMAVQKQILLQTLAEKNLDTYGPSEISRTIRNRLCNIKVLIVLDNVNGLEQFKKLKIKPKFLGAGSRIIITTRDKHTLRDFDFGACEVYNVPPLSNTNALELFRSKAFKRFDPNSNCEEMLPNPNSNCEELIPSILEYAQGLPLAIQVLGSFFMGRVYTEWEDALKRLRNHPPKEIMDVLRFSYKGLENTEQEIFLHIACFFNGERVEYVERILDSCGLDRVIGIRRIMEKSLITIRNCEIYMHKLLEEMGKTIVKEHCFGTPRLWSRLWLYEDFHRVMNSQTGPNNVEAIVLDQKADVSKYGELNAEEFSSMGNLILLILHQQNFSGRLNFLSNSLHYLTWHGYPFTSLPRNFEPSELVELNMPNSNIHRLWKGIKHLPNLKRMDLSNSKYLKKTPNFERMQKLERLDLTGCRNLLLVHSSISRLPQLAFLSLQNCSSLVSLDLCRDRKLKFLNAVRKKPSCELVSLRVLHLSGCKKLEKTPDFMGLSNLEYLDFKQCVSLSTVDKSVGYLKKLKYLSLRGCTNLAWLPPNIMDLRSLQTLDLNGCLKLRNLPRDVNRSLIHLESLIVLDLGFCNLTDIPKAIGALTCLERLNLEGNKFLRLPITMEDLLSLGYLNLAHCHKLQELPELPSQHAPSGGRYFKTESGSRNQRSGLYIFYCPILVDRNRQNNAWFLLALPWLFRLVQAPRYFRCGFDIVLPVGMFSSKWFNHQFEGDSRIRIVSFDAVTDNWIGFAFFATFQANAGPSISNDRDPFFLSFETEQAEEKFSMPLRLDSATTYGSNHLWLIYISRPHCHFVKSGAHISFKAHPHLKIRNWGLRVVSEQDVGLQKLILENQRSCRDWTDQQYEDFIMENQINHIPFNYVPQNRGSFVPKVQLPYNWLVTDEEESENIEAKGKENNLATVGLTTRHHQEHTASSSRT